MGAGAPMVLTGFLFFYFFISLGMVLTGGVGFKFVLLHLV